MAIHFHKGDLPETATFQGDIAVDTETKGLNITLRDRLCLVQLSDGQGDIHLVQLQRSDYATCNRLKAVLADDNRTKIFHYGRFDIAALQLYLGVSMNNVYCTKIASKLCRTYTDRHGLKDICKELLGVDLSKQQQCSDWGGELIPEQLDYAASDVLYLHRLRDKLNAMLKAENREGLAARCFHFLPSRVLLDLHGWAEEDIFAH